MLHLLRRLLVSSKSCIVVVVVLIILDRGASDTILASPAVVRLPFLLWSAVFQLKLLLHDKAAVLKGFGVGLHQL